MAISTFKRYEKKYLLTEQQYRELILLLKNYMEPDAFCKDGACYTIHNIYYDTMDNQLIRHSLSKPYYKEKLRLRSYGVPTEEESKVYLELKKKIGGIVNKRRAEMTLLEAAHFLEHHSWDEDTKYMKNQVLTEISYFLDKNPVIPAVYIGYEREAYFGKDNKDFRVTFDKNIITRREDLSLLKGCYGSQLLEKDQRLMEVKIESAAPIWLTNILSDLKIFSKSFSKYGTEYNNHLMEIENPLRRVI